MFANKFGQYANVHCGLISLSKRTNGGDEVGYDDEEGQQTSPVPIPLESVIIRATLISAVAKVELTQVYVNKEEEAIEAIYYFPIDSNGAVTHFQAELEGRVIEGTVKPAKEAEAQFQKAIENNQTSFLLQANQPDIFKIRVGLLKPGSQVKITIGYITEVKNEKGTNSIRFFIPTTVAPRYIPPTETGKDVLDLKNMSFSLKSPAPLSITVNVAVQGKVKSILSPSHKIEIEEMSSEGKNWSRAVVQLFGKTTDMDRDFVLLVTPADSHVPMLYSEKTPAFTVLMAHLIPSFNLQDTKVELVFVLDRSGSMQGSSIELAKQALTLFLHSLPVDCYFNIVGFGSTFQFLFQKSVKYDDNTLRKASDHCKSLDADLGGTEIFEPLSKILSQDLIQNYSRQVFVLTDGEVGNTEQVIRLCKENEGKTRMFSLGIGAGASHFLVEGMALAGGGTAEFVSYEEAIEAKVLQQLKNATQASLTNVRIAWSGLPEDQTTSETPLLEINKEKTLLGYGKPIQTAQPAGKLPWRQVPENIPPVFDGAQLLVFGIFPNETGKPDGIKITADSPDGPLSIDIQLSEENEGGSNAVLHKLALVKLVRDMEMRIDFMEHSERRQEVNGTLEALRKELIEIACQNGIVSKHTSYIAIDTSESKGDATENWVCQTRYIPSQFTQGWHGLSTGYSGALLQSCAMMYNSGPPVTSSGRGARRVVRSSKSACPPSSGLTGLFGCGGGSQPSFSMKPRGSAVKMCSSNEPEPISMEECDFEEYRPSSASCRKKAKPSATATPKDNLHALVATQSFNGSFALDSAFADAVSKSLEDLTKEANKRGWSPQAWATALALAFFQEKLGDLKDSWELVALKAKDWLESNHSGELEDLTMAASDCIKKGK